MATKTRRSTRANRRIPSPPRPRGRGDALAKVPTGIAGFDVITGGGLPAGRPTLVCGSAGSGKTLLGMQFLVHGASIGEPGVMVSFEESETDLAENIASLGVDLRALVRRKKIVIDHVAVDRSEILETGGYDLAGLFVRLDHAIKSIGAKRIVLDTLEVLFASFQNLAVMRAELERLFHWLKERGITAIVTGERGDGTLTRNGLEEYVSDCVIALDQRVTDQIATRRIRIVKYRGSSHGTNEYPFLVDERGLSILPITGLGLDYPVSTARVLTGIGALDEMLGGKGYFRGSSILVSGMAGTGKSSVAASFVRASCERGLRCLYFALEEPAAQVVRNMRSIGINLAPYTASGILRIAAARPTVFGLEQHLVSLHAAIEGFRPQVVIVDPVSSLVSGSNVHDVKSMLVRLFDYLKLKGITGLFTYLSAGRKSEETEIGVSSLIDTWLELREVEGAGERNRAMYIIKSRGMAHSNQVREFLITSKGLDLVDASMGPQGIMIGSARLVQEAESRAANVRRQEESARRERALERQRKLVAAQIEALRSTLAAEEEEAASARAEGERQDSVASLQRVQMRQSALGRRGGAGSMRRT
jgi:circadian clock protein KaiC